jgi:hypothetical protein
LNLDSIRLCLVSDWYVPLSALKCAIEPVEHQGSMLVYTLKISSQQCGSGTGEGLALGKITTQ